MAAYSSPTRRKGCPRHRRRPTTCLRRRAEELSAAQAAPVMRLLAALYPAPSQQRARRAPWS